MSLPQPSGEFEWVQASWGAALRCRPLAAIAPHYFSTRQSQPEAALAWGLGVKLDALVRMRQVHGAGVFVAKMNGDPLPRPEADIAITDDPALALSVRTADCVPVLIADRRSGAVAAVHAGWKGTAAGAAMVAIRALCETYGAKPQNLVAAVGPSIGPCCYEVGADLIPKFSSHAEAPAWFTDAANPHLDLWQATRDQLAGAGVLAQQIHVCELCTAHHPALFHSYRRDGETAGRLVAAIRNAPNKTP